jgi:DNA-binding NarL/FixJ family response regulator
MLTKEEFESLLPWVLNGTASPAERYAVEAYAAIHPEARAHLAKHAGIRDALRTSVVADKTLLPSSEADATRRLAIVRALLPEPAEGAAVSVRNPEGQPLVDAIEAVRKSAQVTFCDGWPTNTPLDLDPSAALLVVGLQTPSASDVDALRQLRARHPSVPLVIWSHRCERRVLAGLMAAGASACVNVGDSRGVLEGVMRFVLAGGRYIPPELFVAEADSSLAAVSHATDVEKAAQALRKLNKRQLDILRYMVEGRPLKLIARLLGLSPATIKAHTVAIQRALNARSRTEVVKLVRQIPSWD